MSTEALEVREIIVFLCVAGLVVPAMHRLKISPVLGFLAAGLFVGPYGLGRLVGTVPWLQLVVIDDIESVRGLAELGVVFLLFMIGLDLSFKRLLGMRRLVFGLGGAQVAVSTIVISLIALAFGNAPPAATVIGACLALSSTAIVMELLVRSRCLGSPAGHVSFGILLFQDLAVVPVLFLVGVLGADTPGPAWAALLVALGKAAIAIGLILAIGRIVIRPLFAIVGEANSRELFLAAALLVIIATAVGTHAAGLSPALGAFLAGLLFAESEYRHQIEVDLEPFKGLLLGLFFVSVGMSIDMAEVLSEPIWIPLSVIGLICLKATIIYVLARLFGEPRSTAAEAGLLLGQGGEFAFVVIALALSLGLLPLSTAQFMLVVTSLTMLLTPLLAQLAREIGRRIAEQEQRISGEAVPVLPANSAPHVIVAGYGRVGQMLGSLLGEQRIPHVGLDLDANVVSRFREAGSAVYFGNASNPDILRHAGIERAIALALTMDNPEQALGVVRAVRKNWPDLPILARARDMAHARLLIEAGATDVVPETIEASLELAQTVLSAAGFSDEAARQVVAEQRNEAKARAAEPPPQPDG